MSHIYKQYLKMKNKEYLKIELHRVKKDLDNWEEWELNEENFKCLSDTLLNSIKFIEDNL